MSKKHVLELATRIENENLITIDETGTGQLKEGTIDALLPEGLSRETYDKAIETEHEIGSAIAIAFGRQSKAVFDQNKALEQAIIKTPTSNSTNLGVNVQRSRTYTHKLQKNEAGEPVETTVTTEGYTTITREHFSGMSDKSIRKEIQNAWAGLSS